MRGRFLWIFIFAATAAPSAHADENLGSQPYEKSGIVNCALPGTIVEFALNGSGGAILTKMSSNYAPFRKAADSDEAAPLFRDDVAPGFRDDLAPLRLGSCWS
jgi:hypothetical protein